MRENVRIPQIRTGGIAGSVAVISAVALLLSWPALLNGGPFFMSDTVSYIRGAASVFYKAFGLKTAWTSEYLRLFGPVAEHRTSIMPAAAESVPVTLNGRSVYYGALLFAADLAGSLWLVVGAQCGLAATAVFLTSRAIARAVGRVSDLQPLAVGIVAGLVTPLGYFTGYLMPDVFGGFAVLATANILFFGAQQPRLSTAFWLALLAYSLVVHNANPPIVTAMFVTALIYLRWQRARVRSSQLAGVAACLCVALLAQIAFAQAVRSSTGEPPVEPPFLAMRLIADGPGYSYLQHHCSTEQFIYCRTLRFGRLPSDTLLWDNRPDRSLFRGLPPQEQRISAGEQSQFLVAVVKNYPLMVFRTATENSLRQLLDFRLTEFDYSDTARSRFKNSATPATLQTIAQTRAYRGAMPIQFAQILGLISALLSLLLLLGVVFRSAAFTGRNREAVRGYCATILAGFAANAVVCGAISGPNGRYEMRIIWILPVVAGSILVCRARSKRHPDKCPAALDQRKPQGPRTALQPEHSPRSAVLTFLGKSGRSLMLGTAGQSPLLGGAEVPGGIAGAAPTSARKVP